MALLSLSPRPRVHLAITTNRSPMDRRHTAQLQLDAKFKRNTSVAKAQRTFTTAHVFLPPPLFFVLVVRNPCSHIVSPGGKSHVSLRPPCGVAQPTGCSHCLHLSASGILRAWATLGYREKQMSPTKVYVSHVYYRTIKNRIHIYSGYPTGYSQPTPPLNGGNRSCVTHAKC